MIRGNERKSPTSPHARRGRWRRLAGAAVVLALAVAGLVAITAPAHATTEAAHFGAVSAVTMRAIGDKHPHDIHHINDTEFALYNDRKDISHFACNAHDGPKHTHPLVLHDIRPIMTLRTSRNAKNFVSRISSRGVTRRRAEGKAPAPYGRGLSLSARGSIC